MASKGPRSKLDHETRAKRQKALEAPKELPRPKTHWDHVLEEMVWLSKDFESERKWKLVQAKKVAIRASKNKFDQASRGEKKVKEEEQRLRKVALNISKEVKKFWIKIEKLVLYKHQLEFEEKKKKALDKQLDFLLGQTERYSTMLAENLVDMPHPRMSTCPDSAVEQLCIQDKQSDGTDVLGSPESSDHMDVDDEFGIQSEDELQDDEYTIEEDEALITREERKEELEALQDEMDLPLEELLKRYNSGKVSREGSPLKGEGVAQPIHVGEDGMKGKGNNPSAGQDIDEGSSHPTSLHQGLSNGNIFTVDTDYKIKVETTDIKSQLKALDGSEKQSLLSEFIDEQEDEDYVTAAEEEKDDETTLLEEEELAKADSDDTLNEIELLKRESEMSVEELLARYKKDLNSEDDADVEPGYLSTSSEDVSSPSEYEELKQQGSPIDDGVVEQAESDEVTQVQDIDKCLEDVQPEVKSQEDKENEDRIADAAAAARSAQPTGNTFLTTKVRTKFPFLLKHPMREYQHIGLDWLVTMYEKRLNGILADEMGLGKTIMTISLLAHLACEKGIWGPHLIVVPTSVMLNWETEFLKWCPAFKILTYFGSAKERKLKRQGWLKPNSFHICITTYRLVIQDSKAFKRKKWKYLILDEAHLIKNWKSQRWQTLLNFNSKRRILLTGTPLQNDLMELWSLMHFLMPHIFQSHQEFKDWFCNPISGMVEGQEKVNKEVVDRLHNVLRPFILRRLKRDVEKQLPRKYEHVIYCRLSKRQRNLYEDFIASSETQATLASSNFFGMISVIMQLRKVCNHPDLFESRPIISSFDMIGFDMQLSSFICTMLSSGSFSTVDLNGFGFLFTHFDFNMFSWESEELEAIITPSSLIMESANLKCPEKLELRLRNDRSKKVHGNDIFEEIQKALLEERLKQAKERAASIAWWNSLQCRKKPVYGTNLRDLVTVRHPVFDIHQQKNKPSCYLDFSSKLAEIILSPVERFQRMIDLIESFMFAIPAARAPSPVCWCSKVGAPVLLHPAYTNKCTEVIAPLLSPIRPAIVRRQVYFPDRRLIQFDCGKLQELAVLLRRLKSEGHRALIFTQMTKMLDILEAFISLYGYTYMRLDGSTQPEERQTLMQRFNTNPKIFLFILSTRSGGVGINLVGADTVIFYDSDWNPAMDQQAQDRCHRIGQTREVHIYRLISESTIEENILKKANQKRALDDLVIQSGAYNTEFFKKLDPMELFSGHKELPVKNAPREKNSDYDLEGLLSNADVEAALKQAEDEADYMALKKVEQEEAVDNQEFTDEAMLRLEDDEFANEDDLKFDEKTPGDQNGPSEKDVGATSDRNYQNEEKALVLACKEDDTDMLADVKQMAAAAAAAGQASSAFENQLRPIDRYAMQFLNLWDPKVDKSSMESQIDFEETEWELDRIEKFKEDLEAEIDDEEEPLVYERWDADFATEAYRQQVEVLAQRQLMEELEEAKEAEDEIAEAARNEMLTERKPKPKKKKKKTKFKSLKKGALATEAETMHSELPTDSMSIDDEIEGSEHFDFVQLHSPMHKKRKKCQKLPELEEEKIIKKNPKKLKRSAPESSHVGLDVILDKQNTETKKSKAGETLLLDLDHKPVSRSKMGGKISIAVMPVKRVLVVKPEKKKKGNIWTTGSNTSPDSWLSQEDAILCAIIHEYGTNWSLVSEILYGMTAGGLYRGRFRHPVHCCERFRELFQKYVLSSTETPNSEKATNTGSGKAIFKITEDSIQTLLDVARDLPNSDLLLQKHFTAIISSVWRARSRLGRGKSFLSSSHIKFDPGRRFSNSSPFQTSRKSIRNPHENLSFAFSRQSSKFVAAALHDADRMGKDVSMVSSRQRGEDSVEGERLDVTLEALNVKDLEFTLPSVINLSIHGPVSSHSLDESRKSTQLLESSCKAAENRFRVASRACFDGESAGWATSAFSTGDSFRLRPTPKHQSLGKHKAPMSDPPVKSSKLKLQKTVAEPSEPHPISRITFPSTKPVGLGYADSAASVDVLQPFIYHSPGDDEDSGYSLFNLDDRFESDIESLSAFPDHYNPTILSGLEDCILFSDFADIGWS